MPSRQRSRTPRRPLSAVPSKRRLSVRWLSPGAAPSRPVTSPCPGLWTPHRFLLLPSLPSGPAQTGDTHSIAFASTTPQSARVEGLTHTIARVNVIEDVLVQIAQAQAPTSASAVQLRSSVAAPWSRIQNTLPTPAPAPAPVRTYRDRWRVGPRRQRGGRRRQRPRYGRLLK